MHLYFKFFSHSENPYTTTKGIENVGELQSGSNMTGTDLYVNKPHCAAAVRP